MTIRRAARCTGPRHAVFLAAILLLSAACTTLLPRQYEYDEEVNLSLDGSATVYVNGSVPALVALHGLDLDTQPTTRVDRSAIRRMFTGEGVSVTRVSTSRRHGRRFIHIRLAVDDVGKLATVAPLAWSSYKLQRRGDQYVYTQLVGPPTGRPIGDVGWRGNEQVAFRMHLPAKILYHDAPSKLVERGNILVWEQTLADRLKGTPVHIEARLATRSILYTAVTLFAMMALVVVLLFVTIIWWVVRKGRRAQNA